MTPGVWEDLVELRKAIKDMFELLCLLKAQKFHNSKDRALIDHRIDQMRQSYSFLEEDGTIHQK